MTSLLPWLTVVGDVVTLDDVSVPPTTPRSVHASKRAHLRRRALRLQDVLLGAPGEVWQCWWPCARDLTDEAADASATDLEVVAAKLAAIERGVVADVQSARRR